MRKLKFKQQFEMKQWLQVMQKVKSATSLLIFFLVIINCKSVKGTQDVDKIAIMKFRSKDAKTWINVFTYEKEKKSDKIPAIIIVNGVFIEKNKFNVMAGSYELESYFIGKKNINIKDLKIRQGDSIVIMQYMEDHSNPLY